MFYFVIVCFVWVLLPLVPAWITFRITPKQTVDVKGPIHGLIMNAGGAFAAYLVVSLMISIFAFQSGRAFVGSQLASGTWTVSGEVLSFDAEGQATQLSASSLGQTTVRLSPEPHSFSPTHLSLELPLRSDRETVVYLDVPSWGGGRIVLSDSAVERDPLARRILLKSPVILRQQTAKSTVVGLVGRSP